MYNIHTPDKWVVIKIEQTYKLFAMWSGGYLGQDSWRVNSGITKVKEDDKYLLFLGASGSTYKCAKTAYGFNNYGASIMSSFQKEIDIEILPEETDFLSLPLSKSQSKPKSTK